MKKLLRLLGWIVFLGILLVAASMIYSTATGHMTWYFRVDGAVTVNGEKTSGYLHANTQKTVLLITRTDESAPETYLVPLGDKQMIVDCGAWHPIRFLPNAVGDLNLRCSATNVKPADVMDSPVGTTLVQAARSIQFTTASGKKVKAEW